MSAKPLLRASSSVFIPAFPNAPVFLCPSTVVTYFRCAVVKLNVKKTHDYPMCSELLRTLSGVPSVCAYVHHQCSIVLTNKNENTPFMAGQWVCMCGWLVRFAFPPSWRFIRSLSPALESVPGERCRRFPGMISRFPFFSFLLTRLLQTQKGPCIWRPRRLFTCRMKISCVWEDRRRGLVCMLC